MNVKIDDLINENIKRKQKIEKKTQSNEIPFINELILKSKNNLINWKRDFKFIDFHEEISYEEYKPQVINI